MDHDHESKIYAYECDIDTFNPQASGGRGSGPGYTSICSSLTFGNISSNRLKVQPPPICTES